MTTSVSWVCGSEESHNDRTKSAAGSETVKKRCARDSGESRWKKSAIAGASSTVATRIVAVDPSRRISRPNSAESWYGAGMYTRVVVIVTRRRDFRQAALFVSTFASSEESA